MRGRVEERENRKKRKIELLQHKRVIGTVQCSGRKSTLLCALRRAWQLPLLIYYFYKSILFYFFLVPPIFSFLITLTKTTQKLQRNSIGKDALSIDKGCSEVLLKHKVQTISLCQIFKRTNPIQTHDKFSPCSDRWTYDGRIIYPKYNKTHQYHTHSFLLLFHPQTKIIIY